MKNVSDERVSPPGYYGKKMMNAADWEGTQVRKWEREQAERKKLKDFSHQVARIIACIFEQKFE